jgi:hypothetical protein
MTPSGEQSTEPPVPGGSRALTPEASMSAIVPRPLRRRVHAARITSLRATLSPSCVADDACAGPIGRRRCGGCISPAP